MSIASVLCQFHSKLITLKVKFYWNDDEVKIFRWTAYGTIIIMALSFTYTTVLSPSTIYYEFEFRFGMELCFKIFFVIFCVQKNLNIQAHNSNLPWGSKFNIFTDMGEEKWIFWWRGWRLWSRNFSINWKMKFFRLILFPGIKWWI